MKKIVIISGHPNLRESVANATIIEEVSLSMPEIDIRRLDSLYPTYQFDVISEQNALLKADIIIWQFPFSWYSVPGLLKLWIDKVFLHNFSHGSAAKLGGKKLLLSFTTGAPEIAYSLHGMFEHTLEDYMQPFITTAKLCDLEFLTPIYSTGISYVNREKEELIKKQKSEAKLHATRLIENIKTIAQD